MQCASTVVAVCTRNVMRKRKERKRNSPYGSRLNGRWVLVKRPVSSFTTIPSPFVAAHATACSTSALGTSSLRLVFEVVDAMPGVAAAVLGVAARMEKPSMGEKQHAKSSNEAGEALLIPQPTKSLPRRGTLPWWELHASVLSLAPCGTFGLVVGVAVCFCSLWQSTWTCFHAGSTS